ncbi:tail fiber protein [Phreatobacter stygius]|uniref:Tail fiber protein n=1 Tax=Phreatobacter stygius TaxID=1940610 RepID=A0A4D7B3R7_9HYPH|nr:tail fiber protein [Phreatobacter stygius]QCI67531.1 tail fiber protein [Phreatobacter stygius]
MPRNGSGIYSPPPGTTVAPNTLADATAMETRLSDLGAEISASMPINGVRPMTGPLLVVPGSAAAPGAAFAGDVSSGIATVSGRTALVKGGVAGISASATDVQSFLPMIVPDLTVTGTLNSPGAFQPGMMIDYAGATPPTGWLFAAGQVLLRATYPALFAAIGVLHNTGGELGTEFRLPDSRGSITAAPDNMGGNNANRMTAAGAAATTVGGRFGAATHQLTGAETGPHVHIGSTDGAPPFTPTYTLTRALDFAAPGSPEFRIGRGQPVDSSALPTRTGAIDPIPYPSQTFTTASAGSGFAHNNVQPTLFIPKIIKT